MKKIFIVGSVASGKTTFARKLSKKLNIPWYELDCIVHKTTINGRTKTTSKYQFEVISEINKGQSWIFEGSNRESYKFLYEMADTIIFLDLSLQIRRFRIITRFLKQILGFEKCHYKPSIKMLTSMFQWTKDFETERIQFEDFLKKYHSKVRIIRKLKETRL